MGAKIADIAYFLPKSYDLKSILGLRHFEKIYQKSGIKKIHISSQKQSALELAKRAGRILLKKNNPNIDCIIYVSQSPEYFLSSGSCILQDQLGISKNIMTFDVNQGCSGFVYGLCLGSTLIESGLVNNILLVCSDTYSKYISKKNLTCLPILSHSPSLSNVILGE